tara:strand:- start:1560 stop:2993 length:1434 start_codon:yes stop_codon:yes gene_type:complete
VNFKINKISIGVIGLGYVGLPLALRLGKFFDCRGFDIKEKRINELNQLIDKTKEVTAKEIRDSKKILFTSNIQELKNCNIFIITVPTPIDKRNEPDLSPLKKATEKVCKIIKKQDIIIYESTVYPGATENFCGKIISKKTGLVLNRDFYLGYSPERINPGDKDHKIENITKIVSGSNQKISNFIKKIYEKIIKAGVYQTSSIAVAESAKVIENTQRDLNIALINELSIIFNKLNLDTEEILKAAGTKWNFLPFRPGLVGGHCIGVDPYYLTHRSKKVGYNPKLILAGRRLNNNMGNYIVNQLLNEMVRKKIKIKGSKILVMGITFKENCPDFRNSKVVDIIAKLKKAGSMIDVYDPWADKKLLLKEQKIQLIKRLDKNKYDALVGERGIKLSGGQLQRIGIARAIYKQSDVIILDEATSALDNLTEEAVMEVINNINKETTIVIVAHRLSSLKHCSRIIEIKNGKICEIGDFKNLEK